MNIIIRPVKVSDAPHMNEMRRQDGVRENTLGLISETVMKSESFIKNLDENTHILVAELEDKVVGVVGLSVMKNPRMKHSASIGISVRQEFQGKGIGKRLMESILDLADNWLMLIRVELGVIADNEIALKLYKSFGFEMEGKKKYAIIRNGEYVDECVMARYNIPQQFK